MKDLIKMPSLNQVVVLVLLGLSVYLKSPIVACAAVLALAIKEAKHVFESRQKAVETTVLENRVDEVEGRLKSIQNDLNRAMVRQAQYFGE